MQSGRYREWLQNHRPAASPRVRFMALASFRTGVCVRLVFALLVGCFASNDGFAAATPLVVQSSRDPIRIVSLGQGKFRFTKGQNSATLNLVQNISGCKQRLFDVRSGETFGYNIHTRVIDETSLGNSWFVVLQVTTTSGCNAVGYCGGGTTTDLIWVRMVAKPASLRYDDKQSLVIEDCNTTVDLTNFVGQRDGDEPKLEMTNRLLRVEFDAYSASTTKHYTLEYNGRRPQDGLVITDIIVLR